MARKKKPVPVPQYDYRTSYRGPMTTLGDGKRVLTLTEWPKSLIDAYKAGVLCGQAAADAKQWMETGDGVPATKRRYGVGHPWNMAIKNYRSVTGPVR